MDGLEPEGEAACGACGAGRLSGGVGRGDSMYGAGAVSWADCGEGGGGGCRCEYLVFLQMVSARNLRQQMLTEEFYRWGITWAFRGLRSFTRHYDGST